MSARGRSASWAGSDSRDREGHRGNGSINSGGGLQSVGGGVRRGAGLESGAGLEEGSSGQPDAPPALEETGDTGGSSQLLCTVWLVLLTCWLLGHLLTDRQTDRQLNFSGL